MGRPITVNVGALVAADDDAISASQLVAGAQSLVINGAKSDGTTANNICASQTQSGAGDLTINGTLAVSGVAYLRIMRPIYITSAGNDAGVTFTVYGTRIGPAGSFAFSEAVTGANTSVVGTTNSFFTVTRIAASGSTAAAVTVGRGGVGTLDVQRRVIITSGGNDTGITFVLSGGNQAGLPISETITGVSGAAATSVLDYKTVTSIVSSGAAASTVIVGTNAIAASTWVQFDDYAAMTEVAVQATVTGTVNYTVQQTLQDPGSQTNAVAYSSVAWLSTADTNLVGATATKAGSIAVVPVYARVLLNSGSGSVSTVFRQTFLGN